MQPIEPTSIKFEPALKDALKKWAKKYERNNVSLVVKKAVEQYIKFDSEKLYDDPART